MYMLMRFALCLSCFILIAFGSDITVFQDLACKTSLRGLDTANGYPDGLCQPLGPNLKSFQIVGLDEGCVVTLYGPNTNELTCSADIKIVAEKAACYNSSWVYYSIDNCLPPSSTTVKLPTLTPTNISPSDTPQNTDGTSPQPSSSTGVIVGGVVGGVSSLVIIGLVALLFVRRRRKHLQSAPPTPPPKYELSSEQAVYEARYRERARQEELWSADAVTEIGRNSLYIPPAELAGDAVLGEDKKGLKPILGAH
ncbi:hypothetical protein BS50DRAFT_671492 [Corynespora cassiicola Philippines]|uniref:Uncharacterized protein n=1 Tax=Corynespora cassiicola Philippines TaxID=1448308 RepID=A0A2T2PCC3_CORCC|nr:hypothetical protein BS50DRAFT_671492 [Corynespora cassiicola Philippines]